MWHPEIKWDTSWGLGTTCSIRCLFIFLIDSTMFKNSGLGLLVKNLNVLATLVPNSHLAMGTEIESSCSLQVGHRTTRMTSSVRHLSLWPLSQGKKKEYYLNTSGKHTTHYTPNGTNENTNRFKINPWSINTKSFINGGLGDILNIFEFGMIKGNLFFFF